MLYMRCVVVLALVVSYVSLLCCDLTCGPAKTVQTAYVVTAALIQAG